MELQIPKPITGADLGNPTESLTDLQWILDTINNAKLTMEMMSHFLDDLNHNLSKLELQLNALKKILKDKIEADTPKYKTVYNEVEEIINRSEHRKRIGE